MSQLQLAVIKKDEACRASLDFMDSRLASMVLLKLKADGCPCRFDPAHKAIGWKKELLWKMPIYYNYRIIIFGSSIHDCHLWQLKAKEFILSYQRLTGEEHSVKHGILP